MTDLGFAKVLEGRIFTFCGTPEYLAPEILLNKGHGKPVDWWTFGVIVYEMLTGVDPFTASDPMTIYKNILKGKVRVPKNFDRNAKSLVKRLLVADLGKRFGNLKKGVQDIKGHKWLVGIDWPGLLQKRVKMPYVPVVTAPHDTSNFSKYPDSINLSPSVKEENDPFLKW